MKKFQVVVALVLAVIFLILFGFDFRPFRGAMYRSYRSPDGRFEVVVYRTRQWFGTMPGQSSDAPGTICLYDTNNRKLLHEQHVEMVQLADPVTWTATNVNIGIVANWKLGGEN